MTQFQKGLLIGTVVATVWWIGVILLFVYSVSE